MGISAIVNPEGPCIQIAENWPENSPYIGTLGPKHILLGHMDPYHKALFGSFGAAFQAQALS